MIENDAQLAQAREVLMGLEAALTALRARVGDANPALFHAMAQDYVEGLVSLRSDVDAYLGQGPRLQGADIGAANLQETLCGNAPALQLCARNEE